MDSAQKEQSMRRTDGDWVVLVIDDSARFAPGRRAAIEEQGNRVVITTRTREDAFFVLATVEVDAVYNLPETETFEESMQFRRAVAKLNPRIRIVDLWSLPSHRAPTGDGELRLSLLLHDVESKRRRFREAELRSVEGKIEGD